MRERKIAIHWMWHYFSLFWLPILKWIMKQIALENFMKKNNRYISTTIAVAKMELFVALSSSLQPLMYSITKMHSEICAGDQIKYWTTVACNFSKTNLFHWLMNFYLNSSSICISYPISLIPPRLQILIFHVCWRYPVT